jgi:hypothetical protein
MRWIITFLFIPCTAFCQSIWINELHYDNSGADLNEFIEVVSDTVQDSLFIYLYNGINGLPYDSVLLDTLFWNNPDPDYYTVIWQPDDIQNGSPDGAVLLRGDSMLEAIAYEGEFTGISGPAAGILFKDIDIRQDGSSQSGWSLQRTGYGSRPGHFTWSLLQETPLGINEGQVITSEPFIITDNDTLKFADTPIFDHSSPLSFKFYAVNINDPVSIYIPPGFEISPQPDFSEIYSFSSPLNVIPDLDWIPSTEIFVRFSPDENKVFSDDIILENNQSRTVFIHVSGREGNPDKPNAWINEFHYDNDGVDTLEFVEVVIQYPERYDLDELTLYLYNGTNGSPYNEAGISDAWPGNREDGEYQFYVFPLKGIQNGPADGIGLTYNDQPLDFISYEGEFTASEGPLAGRRTHDISAMEESISPLYSSVQLVGEGKISDDFDWVFVPGGNTAGKPNINQILPIRLLSHNFVYGNPSILSWRTADEETVYGYLVEALSSSASDSLTFIHSELRQKVIHNYNVEVLLTPDIRYLRVSHINYEFHKRILFTIPVTAEIRSPCFINENGNQYIWFPVSWLNKDVNLSLLSLDGRVLSQLYDHVNKNLMNLNHWTDELSTNLYFIRAQNDEEEIILRVMLNK